MVDRGLTHVALPVSNLNASIAFYTTYARMQVVHRRTVPTTEFEVAWLSDTTRPFVLVLSERSQVDHPLVPPAHLGVACASREDVERLCALARAEGRLLNGPRDAVHNRVVHAFGCRGVVFQHRVNDGEELPPRPLRPLDGHY